MRGRLLYRGTKRLFDCLAGLAGVIVTSPLWLIAAVGIFCSDPGPVFYVARRVGREGREFPMYKFRSMRQGKANEAVFRGEEDRIFPFGRVLRATKIDELPQLLCCIQGTMSVIGPRPAARDQVNVTRSGPYEILSSMKPGLSGPGALYDYLRGDRVQDEQEYMDTVLPTRLALEVYYVDHCGWGYDLKLIWYTVVCIVFTVFGREPKPILKELLAWAEEKTPAGAAG